MTDNRIRLSLMGDTAFCFNADDYMTIRTEYRLIGKLVGSTVKWPRNTNVNGLPAAYSPCETQLLIDKGIVQLCKKTFSNVPNETFEKQYEEACENNVKSYKEVYMEKRIEEAKNLMPKILAGKRKKVQKTGGNPDDVTEESILNDVRKRAVDDAVNVYIQVPTEDPFDVDFEEIKTAPNLEQFKYHVFCDLWEKGHWLTSGATFGGDFLVYPGEPLIFHASHIIHILSDDEAKSMSTQTFITRSRLSVNVNKLCTFAYKDTETKKLCYQTVQWLGK